MFGRSRKNRKEVDNRTLLRSPPGVSIEPIPEPATRSLRDVIADIRAWQAERGLDRADS